MQDEPDGVRLIETQLDEVIPGAERAHVVRGMRAGSRPWMLANESFMIRSQRVECRRGGFWNAVPGAAIARAAVVGATVRHRRFDRGAKIAQIVGKLLGSNAEGHGCHAATDVDPD